MLRAGLHWPGRALPSLDEIVPEWRGDGGIVPIVFYRALVQSGNTAPVDALVQALLRDACDHCRSSCIASRMAKLQRCWEIFAACPPAVILNATGFSLCGAPGGDDPLRADCPVLQMVFAGGDEESWRVERGALARAISR